MFTQIKNFLVLLMVITIAFPSACKTKYPPLRIGNSIGIKDMNYELQQVDSYPRRNPKQMPKLRSC